MKKINNPSDGWYLPATQRPYVWGSRHENETYICKLFDSILKGYPIGGLIIWKTDSEIPYREFMNDYHQLIDVTDIVEKGRYDLAGKGLVYDGQQRLQTLFSCLRYTFNNKVLVFDLLFKKTDDSDPDETGFSFVEQNIELSWNIVKLNQIFTKVSKDKVRYEDNILIKAGDLENEIRLLVKENFELLWKAIVEDDKDYLSFFPISSTNEIEVNEIFQRLNSGGIPLSLTDLLLSEIKIDFPDFEQKLIKKSQEIYSKTGNGYLFTGYNILQLLNLIIKGQVRVDPKKVKPSERKSFNDTWTELGKPLLAFFTDFIWGVFKINRDAIIPSRMALLPILVYFYEIYRKGFAFKYITATNLQIIKQFFIKSQINDWSIQSYIDNFADIISEESKLAESKMFDFPLAKIESKINEKQRRDIDIKEARFVDYGWFALKILSPTKEYHFEQNIQGRFNPEIDHIFPVKLKDKNQDYEKVVDVIWNMQPVKGEINMFKTNHHPQLFFTDQAVNAKGEKINGSKYVGEYEFFFPKLVNNSVDFNDPIWVNSLDFINERRKLMLEFLKITYDLTLV